MWTRDSSSFDVISSDWNKLITGSPPFQLSKKLKKMKKALKMWNRNYFGKVQKRIRDLRNLLDMLQRDLPSEETMKKEKKAQRDLQELLVRERVLWKRSPNPNGFKRGMQTQDSFTCPQSITEG